MWGIDRLGGNYNILSEEIPIKINNNISLKENIDNYDLLIFRSVAVNDNLLRFMSSIILTPQEFKTRGLEFPYVLRVIYVNNMTIKSPRWDNGVFKLGKIIGIKL